MALNKALKKFIQDAKESDSYWIERAKLSFAMELEKQRRSTGMTYAALAKKIQTSAAYITKIFRGDSNLTIESMVKLANASGGRLNIEIVNKAAVQRPWDAKIRLLQGGKVDHVTGAATVIHLPQFQSANVAAEVQRMAA